MTNNPKRVTNILQTASIPATQHFMWSMGLYRKLKASTELHSEQLQIIANGRIDIANYRNETVADWVLMIYCGISQCW